MFLYLEWLSTLPRPPPSTVTDAAISDSNGCQVLTPLQSWSSPLLRACTGWKRKTLTCPDAWALQAEDGQSEKEKGQAALRGAQTPETSVVEQDIYIHVYIHLKVRFLVWLSKIRTKVSGWKHSSVSSSSPDTPGWKNKMNESMPVGRQVINSCLLPGILAKTYSSSSISLGGSITWSPADRCDGSCQQGWCACPSRSARYSGYQAACCRRAHHSTSVSKGTSNRDGPALFVIIISYLHFQLTMTTSYIIGIFTWVRYVTPKAQLYLQL